MHDWDDWGAGGWLLMGSVMLAFWLLVATGVVAFLRAGAARRPRALDILDERYARGEIGDEEYRRQRATLGVG